MTYLEKLIRDAEAGSGSGKSRFKRADDATALLLAGTGLAC